MMPKPLPADRPIRWGVLGAGGIADTVSHDISAVEGNVVTAVAARNADRAAAFAARHGAAHSYGSYAQLLANDDIDVVYVATTHPSHHALALKAIAAGKAVLIEKPLCLNAAEAREVFAAARQADVFAMEAMWMRTNPLILKARQLVADGAIGQVRGVRSEFGLGIPFDPGHRLYDIDNGGGALLDLGVYPATFAHLFLGHPDQVITSGTLAATAADDTVAMQWLYDGVPKAQLWASVPVSSPNESAILGADGWIKILAPMFRPSGLIVRNVRTGAEYTVDDPIAGQGAGYGPEIREVARCLRAGEAQSPLVPHADTIAILELLDGARAALGVTYPSEKKAAA
jgi:predicted dehydrogenase